MERLEQARILRAAAQYIREHGFYRGASGWNWPDGGGVCIEGALAAATQTSVVDARARMNAPAFKESLKLLGQRVGFPPGLLFVWNDQRVVGDVLALLEDTAFDLELAAQIKAESPVPPPVPEPEPDPAPEPVEVQA